MVPMHSISNKKMNCADKCITLGFVNSYEHAACMVYCLWQYYVYVVFMHVINALTQKFISWKQPFPGIEHVAHFPVLPLTLHPLHRGQTSRGKCARVASTFDPVNAIHES